MSVRITHNALIVAKQIKAYTRQLTSKYNKVVKRIAELGGTVAEANFSTALYAGDNDVVVKVKRVSNTHYQVIASGETVLFIEFGTGVSYPELVEPSGLTYIHGTYGKLKGLNPNGWAYVGEQGNAGIPIEKAEGVFRTKGNPPARAMYDASMDMRAEIERIFREEFHYK